MEPIARRPHPVIAQLHPEYEATQSIINCGNGYGLSVLNAKGSDRWHTGIYCTPDTYEICLIKFNQEPPSQAPFDFEHWHKEAPHQDVMGWVSIEGVGEVADRIRRLGVEGYRRD